MVLFFFFLYVLSPSAVVDACRLIHTAEERVVSTGRTKVSSSQRKIHKCTRYCARCDSEGKSESRKRKLPDVISREFINSISRTVFSF